MPPDISLLMPDHAKDLFPEDFDLAILWVFPVGLDALKERQEPCVKGDGLESDVPPVRARAFVLGFGWLVFRVPNFGGAGDVLEDAMNALQGFAGELLVGSEKVEVEQGSQATDVDGSLLCVAVCVEVEDSEKCSAVVHGMLRIVSVPFLRLSASRPLECDD